MSNATSGQFECALLSDVYVFRGRSCIRAGADSRVVRLHLSPRVMHHISRHISIMHHSLYIHNVSVNMQHDHIHPQWEICSADLSPV